MNLSYTITTAEGSLRTIHNLTIDGKKIVTTRANEVLLFAKPLIPSKYHYSELKDAIRLGNPIEINR